ncbi:hypothetical protein [Saccharolobus shibatae]|uniref:Uncharacterized protein n=2 Tax=Saccharolobus shibatae TaxID=2286 RepID=A0A8F5BWW5_9CREN|nr:hypothetical protein [Saccharolobus shibatae]QXJ29599.1 hypothetical protein J5U23_02472 [Saccharolobus shibatae B12]QXJ32828.1 hypothetical protein J5U21_02483 [Saccharolobus shibatae]QXJ35958.1 hypothetical protein J5U22_02509 [Saccharolobus shibatae]
MFSSVNGGIGGLMRDKVFSSIKSFTIPIMPDWDRIGEPISVIFTFYDVVNFDEEIVPWFSFGFS